MPFRPFREDDWNFFNSKTLPPEFVGQLNLEAVTVGADLVQVQSLKRTSAKAFVATGGIGDGHPGDFLHINRCAFA